MSEWTSKYDILRDLSVAQGRVPVAIEGIVRAGEKPPPLNIAEETEEEYFKGCSAEADVSIAPDLGLIKQMLDMVRNINVSSNEAEFSNKAVVISKPHSSNFVPKTSDTSTPMCQSPKKQKEKDKTKKRQRNVAVESILQAIADNKKIENMDVISEPIKLLKPNDFISITDLGEGDTETTNCIESNQSVKTAFTKIESKTPSEVTKDIKDINETEEVSPTVVEKVNGWFNTLKESPFPKRVPKVALEATQMTSIFKRKTVTDKVKNVKKVKSPTMYSGGEYKPSELATEYYQKYVERTKFKDSVKTDIWSKAEKKMKKIDNIRRREVSQTLSSPSSSSQNGDQSTEDAQSTTDNKLPVMPFTTSDKVNRCLDVISLPQHRHLLTGECIVCKVMAKKPTDSDNEEIEEDTDLNVTGGDEKNEADPICDETIISENEFL